MSKGASDAKINEHLSQVDPGKIYWSLYKNYPDKGTYTLLDAVGMDRYCCSEKQTLPDWKIVADSTKTILGYTCHLATAIYKGRKWSAWYAEDIPLSEGPWELCGLPGLILSACDAQRQYVFGAVGMEQIKGDANIFYKGGKYEPIDKKMLNKVYARYNADPVGYINNNPNHHVTVTDKDGNPYKPTAIPYNPIER
jgi:GLPGLI family protein